MSTTAASRVMARGRGIELRLWERDPAGERAFEPDEDHERAVYVQAGALIVTIGDKPPIEVHAGDSYVIPTGQGHRNEVLEPAVVVEAISPCDRLN
jgi:quercetin dioxygenase-like cupin family protein